MKTTVTVKKIPTDAIFEIMLKMREAGVEHVNFVCEMTPTQDNVTVVEYRPTGKDSNQHTLDIDFENVEEQRIDYIKKILKGDNGTSSS